MRLRLFFKVWVKDEGRILLLDERERERGGGLLLLLVYTSEIDIVIFEIRRMNVII